MRAHARALLTVVTLLLTCVSPVLAEAPPGPVLFWGIPGPAPTQLDHPFAIASDGIGQLYVADQHNDRVSVFGPTGDLLNQWGSNGDGEGFLYHPTPTSPLACSRRR